MLIYLKKINPHDPNWGIMFVGSHRHKLDLSQTTKENPKEVDDEWGADLVRNNPKIYGIVKPERVPKPVILKDIPEAEKVIDEMLLDDYVPDRSEPEDLSPEKIIDYSGMNKSELWKAIKETGKKFEGGWTKSSRNDMLVWLNAL